jgi:hypothetical protein
MLHVDPIHCYYSYTCIFLFSTFIPIILDLGIEAKGHFHSKTVVGFESCAILPIVEALLFAPIVNVYIEDLVFVMMVGGDGGGKRTHL